MAFRNPILAGISLIRAAIQSPNYSHNSAGWTVRQDGSAEFNNLNIRGGTVTDSPALYYNGTPAAGNLIASVAAAQGTDTYGNTYFQGVCTYDNAGQTFTQLVGHNFFSGRMSDAQNNVSGLGYATITNTEKGTVPTSVLSAPTNGAYAYHGAVLAIPGSDSTEANGPGVYVAEQSGGAAAWGRISGAWLKTDNAGNALKKQSPAYGSGWASGAAGGTYRGLQFWLDAMDNLVLSGSIHSTSTTPSGTIFTLPAGYIPKSPERPGVTANAGGTYSLHSLEISATGAVSVDPPFSVSGADLYVYASMPMGNAT